MKTGPKTFYSLAETFYGRVGRNPALKPFFPGKSLRCATEELAAFLTQLFGGPVADTQHRWWLSLRESHARFQLGPKERAAWLADMREALKETVEEPLRSSLTDFFEHASGYIVGAPEQGGSFEHEARWRGQLRLDAAVAAIRAGQAERATALLADPDLAERLRTDRASLLGVLDIMLAGPSPELRDLARQRLRETPALAHERFAGWTLLHFAAARAALADVEFLLELGADPNALDHGEHAPLYAAGNGFGGPESGAVVRALVRAGADVNANLGAKRCTALHMAARRGNLEIAEALLDLGARIDPPDSNGVTPLGRALNCRKRAVAEMLVARGGR